MRGTAFFRAQPSCGFYHWPCEQPVVCEVWEPLDFWTCGPGVSIIFELVVWAHQSGGRHDDFFNNLSENLVKSKQRFSPAAGFVAQ